MARPNGTIVNADGKVTEKEAWGKTSNWVDYFGDPGDGSTVGVAILDHPANSRRAHWHVRGYGLFAANPFGDKTFVDSKTKEDSVTLEPGQKLHFRYLIVIHNGDTSRRRNRENLGRLLEEVVSQQGEPTCALSYCCYALRPRRSPPSPDSIRKPSGMFARSPIRRSPRTRKA
jgi:hypothetical protein